MTHEPNWEAVRRGLEHQRASLHAITCGVTGEADPSEEELVDVWETVYDVERLNEPRYIIRRPGQKTTWEGDDLRRAMEVVEVMPDDATVIDTAVNKFIPLEGGRR